MLGGNQASECRTAEAAGAAQGAAARSVRYSAVHMHIVFLFVGGYYVLLMLLLVV
jgi:hypothetical protein